MTNRELFMDCMSKINDTIANIYMYDKIENIKINFNINNIDNISVKSTGHYFKWSATIKKNNDCLDTMIVLNPAPNQKVKYKLYCLLKCVECGKNTKIVLLSSLFQFLKCNTIKLKPVIVQRCKQCNGARNAIIGITNSKRTCLERYGCEYSFQSENNKNKALKTKIARYGKDWGRVISRKMWAAYKKKTGFAHNTHDPKIQAKMTKTWKKTISTMSQIKKDRWNKRRMEAYNKEGSPGMFGPFKSTSRSISTISTQFFNDIEERIPNYNFKYGKNNEQNFGTKYVDCLIEDICIIEYYGSFWHADPTRYLPNEIVNLPGNICEAKNIWKRDANRLSSILDMTNLPILIVWGYDYRRNKDLIIGQTIDIIENIKRYSRCDNIINVGR